MKIESFKLDMRASGAAALARRRPGLHPVFTSAQRCWWRSCWQCHALPAAMSKTARLELAREFFFDPLRSVTKWVTASRLEAQDTGTFSKLAACPSLKTPARRLLDVTVDDEPAPPKTLEKKEEVPRWNKCRTHWARQVGASSTWFYSLAWIFLSSAEHFLRDSDRYPARQTETCEYEPCVNLALRSWTKVEVHQTSCLWISRSSSLSSILFFFLFFYFFFLHILETGKVKTPPPPNGHARILVNAEIYGRSLTNKAEVLLSTIAL